LTRAERRRIAVKKWKVNNPDKVKEMGNKSHRICYARNPKKRQAEIAAWQAANHGKVLTAVYEWRKRNPEQVRIWNRKYRANRLGSTEHYTTEQWAELKSVYGNRCVCCGRHELGLAAQGLMLVPDHIVALACGGTDDIGNIQPLCHGKGGCNNKKNKQHKDYR